MNCSLSSSSMLLVLLLLNALIIFGVPAGDRGNQSRTHLNESSQAVISNELNHGVSHQSHFLMADALTTDFSKIGRNVGNDVVLFGEGRIPVVLRGTSLQFQACNSCSGTSHVCYKSDDDKPTAETFCRELTSYCGFKVETIQNGDEKLFLVNRVSVEDTCPTFAMRYSNVTFGDGYSFPSCEPIIEDQMVMLESYAQSSCPITIPNAYIPDPPTTTISPARSHEASDSSAAVQSANFFETTEGIVVIVICVIVVILAIIGVILCLLCKKTKLFKSKAKEVNVESIQIDQPEYTVVEDAKKSEAEVPKKQQPKMKIEKLPMKENVVEKKKKDAEAPKKLEGKAPKKVVEPAKKAAEEPRKNSDEPKMKSDPTQQQTEDGGPLPVIDEDAPASLPLPAVAVQKDAAKPKNAAPQPASNNQLPPPSSKHHRRHHVKRAPPTFEAPSTPSTSDSEAPPPLPVATAVKPRPQKKKKMSPTLDSQDRERRRMIRSGQAVKPRPGENIRKYLPKNY